MTIYRTVLLTRFSAFGDVAMTVPVVYSACRCYPDIAFVFVTRPAMTSIFVDAPANLTIVGVDVSNEYEGVAGLRKLSAELVGKYSPDVFIDLHNVLRTNIMAIFMRLAGVPSVRIVKPRAQRRALTRRHNKVMLPIESQLSRYNDAFVKAGLPLEERFDGLYGGRGKADPSILAAITPPKTAGEKWVGIAPFAAHKGKIYPPGQMEEVVSRLQADADKGMSLRVFLFGGGEEERQILDSWQAKYPCATSLAGKRYGFAVELALLNHIDVAVAMDSANMHLASLAGTPLISIWGATHPYCGFKGWHQTDNGIIQLPLECRPCSVFGDKPCFRGDYLCLAAIKPDIVYRKIYNYISDALS